MSQRRDIAGGPDLDTAIDESPRHGSTTNARPADERSGAPFPTSGDTPTGDDPYVAGADDVAGGVEPTPLDPKEQRAAQMAKQDPTGENGPTYERHDNESGGSTDPHNSLGLTDSGLEPRRE